MVVLSNQPRRATYSTSQGELWNEPQPIGFVFKAAMAAKIGDSVGALEHISSDDLLYRRMLSYHGTDWSAPVVINGPDRAGGNARLIDAGGHPAALYFDINQQSLKYVRALDPDGEAWGAPRIISTRASATSFELGLHADRPVVIFHDRVELDLNFVAAGNTEGSSWSQEMALPPVPPFESPVLPMSYHQIQGHPALAILPGTSGPILFWIYR